MKKTITSFDNFQEFLAKEM